MTAWRTVWLVAKRELVTRKRAFRISTALIVGLAIAGLVALSISGIAEGAEIPEEEGDAVVAMIGTVILFGTIVGYGQMTLLGVAEEKSSRVVEVVLGCVEPRTLLMGKVLGIGSFALAQTGIVLVGVVGTASVLDTVPIPASTWPAALTVLGFFLLGFAFYATVYAAFGALMPRTENASNAAGPLNLFVSIGYVTAMISLSGGNAHLARIFSLIPPFTPTVMPMRIVGGLAAPWEVALAVALLVASIYGVTRWAARLYIGGIMRGDAKTAMRQAWRAASL